MGWVGELGRVGWERGVVIERWVSYDKVLRKVVLGYRKKMNGFRGQGD